MSITLRKIMKRSLYTIEGAAVYCMYTLLLILPVDTASYICGLIMRKIGPLFKANKIAKKNIAMCFPNLTQESISQIISDMWDNLGRNIGELPYSSRYLNHHLKNALSAKKALIRYRAIPFFFLDITETLNLYLL
jgi:lauroyl/myristoyl acyltransferase